MSTTFAPATLDELAQRLVRRRATVEHIISTSLRDASSAVEDPDVSDFLDSNEPDAGSNDVDRGRALVLAALATANLHAIDQALVRVSAGTYGICDGCGTRIPLARLRALPETAVCVACKSGSRLSVLGR